MDIVYLRPLNKWSKTISVDIPCVCTVEPVKDDGYEFRIKHVHGYPINEFKQQQRKPK